MDLITLLRRRTRVQHSRLDAGLDFKASRITAVRYRAFLQGVAAVVTPLEPVLCSWPGAADGSSRAQRLHADLAQLGVHGAVTGPRVRVPRSLAEAYGCAYVLEGSALGGLVLAPAVERALGSSAPTSYLRLHGADTARRWRAWLERLAAFGAAASPEALDAACDMACATFDAYEASLVATGALQERSACIP